MELDLMDLYRLGSDWTGDKVAGVKDLEGSTPCSEWKLRDLLNHILDTQRYFARAGRGESATPPGPNPPDTVSDTPADDFAQARSDVISAFSEEGVIEKTMPALGVAFTDALIHGWDVAKATGQDATMPDGLAQAAYTTIHGRFTDEQRKGLFAPEVPVADDATPQQRLLAIHRAHPGLTVSHARGPGCTSAHVARAVADRGRGVTDLPEGSQGSSSSGRVPVSRQNAVRTQPHMAGREGRYAI